jgi:hypothetical protein
MDKHFWKSIGVTVLFAVLLSVVVLVSMNPKVEPEYAPDMNKERHAASAAGVGTSVVVPVPDDAQLELLGWNWEEASESFLEVQGQVKNITSANLDDIEVVVNFYTSDGAFVRSDSALIEYNPILPGQVSPFKVIVSNNPEIKKCSVEFKVFAGGTIPTRDKSK